MKIMQVIDNLGIGGAAKVQVIFGRAAAANHLDLIQVSFGSGQDEPLKVEFEKAAIPVAYFPAPSLFDLGRIIRFTRFVQNTRPDIMQTHLTYQNIIGCIAGKIARTPVVCTLHSVRIKDEYYHPVRFWLEVFCLKYLAHRVIAVGESVKEAYIPHLGKKEILVVPNPINPQITISTGHQQALKRSLFPGECRIAIAVGRLAAPKAYPDLIQAFATVFKKHPDVRLLIVGGGELHDEIQAIIDANQLNDLIQLQGECENVAELLAVSDVFVSASHWEGLPISLLEAMATGLPVVATRVGDIPRVVHSETGILVSPAKPDELAQAIIHLLDDPALSRKMGEAGREYAMQNHSLQAWMDRLLEIFQQSITEYAA
jgi:glycosyltransferase involved in cell wall biosynthesis